MVSTLQPYRCGSIHRRDYELAAESRLLSRTLVCFMRVYPTEGG